MNDVCEESSNDNQAGLDKRSTLTSLDYELIVVPNFDISSEDKRTKEIRMYVRLTFAVLATLIGLCGAAQADIFGAGPAYGGPGSAGGRITCRIFNFGVFPVSITTRQIFTNTNVSIVPTSDTCNVALGSAKYCAFTAPIIGNLAYSCRVIAQGTTTNISGVAEIQLPNGSISTTLPLQK